MSTTSDDEMFITMDVGFVTSNGSDVTSDTSDYPTHQHRHHDHLHFTFHEPIQLRTLPPRQQSGIPTPVDSNVSDDDTDSVDETAV